MAGSEYTVGVLVQCNFGGRRQLRIAGVPVGQDQPTRGVRRDQLVHRPEVLVERRYVRRACGVHAVAEDPSVADAAGVDRVDPDVVLAQRLGDTESLDQVAEIATIKT